MGRAARSLVLPGWGQWSNDEDGKGTTFFVLAAVGILFGSGAFGLSSSDSGQQFEQAAGWGLYGASTVVSVFDAYRVAERINRENGYDLAASEAPGIRIALLRLRFDVPAP